MIIVLQPGLDMLVLVLCYQQHMHQKSERIASMLQVFQNISILAWQEIALCGDEKESNFMQLLMRRKMNLNSGAG